MGKIPLVQPANCFFSEKKKSAIIEVFIKYVNVIPVAFAYQKNDLTKVCFHIWEMLPVEIANKIPAGRK